MSDVIEQDEDISQDEPHTELPGASREDTYREAESEGVSEAIITALAEKEDVTAEDLRQIPGSDGKSDEELLAEWEKAKAGLTDDKSVEGETKVELPFPVYNAKGEKVAADKVTLEALFKGELQIGYTAMGKEQRKALSDVIRNASQGHWNEHRYTTVQGQLKQSQQELQTLRSQVEQFGAERGQWNAALTSLIAGDKGPMERLVNAYQQALTKTGNVPPGFISEQSVQEDAALAQAGMRWMSEVAMPTAWQLAQTYEANPKEVYAAIEQAIGNEPMLTAQRLQEIIQFDIPMLLEQNGYSAKGTTASPAQGGNDVTELRKTVEALQGRLAKTTNASTETTRQKGKKAPPAGSGSVSGAGDAMPAFKSRAQFKAWAANDPEWAKA